MSSRHLIAVAAISVSLTVAGFSQTSTDASKPAETSPQSYTFVVPADTQIPLALNHAVNGKNAKVGDSIYLVSTFPVAIQDRIVIPVGTYVQGEVSDVKRPGRIHGRGQILVHFTRMIMPNGYTIRLAGSLDNAPELDDARVKGKEGTIVHEPEKGKDAAKVAVPTGYGAIVGAQDAAIRGSSIAKGALIGGGIGAAAGIAWVLLGRGSDIYLPRGTQLTMVLQRPLELDGSRLNFSNLPTPIVPPRPEAEDRQMRRSRLPLPVPIPY